MANAFDRFDAQSGRPDVVGNPFDAFDAAEPSEPAQEPVVSQKPQAPIRAEQPKPPYRRTPWGTASDIPERDPQYDSFADATGKSLDNVPERLQQSFGGLVQMLGEDMGQERERFMAQSAQRLGITPHEYKLLAWAGNKGLVPKEASVPDALASLKEQMVNDLTPEQQYAVADMGLINPAKVAIAGEALRRDAEETMQPINAEPGSAAYYTSAAIGSIAEMTPALLASVLTRNPATGMSIIGGQVGGESYGRARDAGKSIDESQTYALAQAAAEAIPEYLPIASILKPGANFFGKMAKTGAAESVQEMITGALQAGIDKGMIEPDMTWGEARQQIIDSGIIGLIAGPGMAAMMEPLVRHQNRPGLQPPQDTAPPVLSDQVQDVPNPVQDQAAPHPADDYAPVNDYAGRPEWADEQTNIFGDGTQPEATVNGNPFDVFDQTVPTQAEAQPETATAENETGQASDDLSPYERNQLREAGVTDEQLWDMPTEEARQRLEETQVQDEQAVPVDEPVQSAEDFLGEPDTIEQPAAPEGVVQPEVEVAPEPTQQAEQEAPDAFLDGVNLDKLNYTNGLKDIAAKAGVETKPGTARSEVIKRIKAKFPERFKGETPQDVAAPVIKTKRGDSFRNTRNTGQRFHGSSTEIASLDDNKWTSENIYGQGFYTTDAVDIASGYGRKGSGGTPTLYETKVKGSPKLYDLNAPMTDDIAQDAQEVLGDLLEEGVEYESLGVLMDEARANSVGERVPADEVQEMFDQLRARLEGRGYRGYKHLGGDKTKNPQHDVRIFWQPSEDIEIEKSDFNQYRADGEQEAAPAKPAQQVDQAAAEVEQSPTEAQKEAGNYKKGHLSLQGLNITLENPRGSTRSGTDPDGNAWESEMAHHYGYIKRTEGADGDHVDVFIGPDVESDRVFIIDQVNADGSFDEHKVMLGFKNQAAARQGYKANYDKGWKVGPTSAMSMDEFKAWLKDGDTTKPVQADKVKPEKAQAWKRRDKRKLWDGPDGMVIADHSMTVGGTKSKMFMVFASNQDYVDGNNFATGESLAEAKKLAAVGPTESVAPPSHSEDTKAILDVFRELGRENPDVEYGAVGNRNNGLAKRIEEAAGRKLTAKQVREAASQRQKEAAYKEGRQAGAKSATESSFSRDGFRRTTGFNAESLSVEQAEQIRDEITKTWEGAPEIIIRNKVSRFPPDLQAAIRAAGAESDMRGVLWGDDVYLLASRIPDRQAMERVILHEVIGHYGLRKMLGKDMERVLNQIWAAHGGKTRADFIIRRYYPGTSPDNTFDVNNKEHRHTIAEELIAHLAEQNRGQTLVQRAVAIIREGLRKLGFTIEFTVDDIVNLLRRARKTVENGGFEMAGDTALNAAPASRFSRALHGIPDAEVEAFNDFLNRYESGKAKQGEEFVFESTPAILTALGAGGHRLVISAGVVQKAVGAKHDLSLEALRSLPDQLSNPVMVFDSQTAPDGLVVLTELTDNRGKPVVVAVHMNRKGRSATINRIASVHAKESAGQVKSWIGKGLLAYRNKKKARSWPRLRPLQLRWEGVRNTLRGKVLTEKDVFVNTETRYSRDTQDGQQTEAVSPDAAGDRESQAGLNRSNGSVDATPASKADDRGRERIDAARAEVSSETTDGVVPPGTRFSRAGIPDLDPQPFGPPSDTLLRKTISKIADKFTVLKGVQKNIKDLYGPIDESADAYMAEELFHGKVENDVRLIQENMIEPLAKEMSEHDVSLKQLDEFLYALHAPERNRVIAERNPAMPDGGSGMTNAEAATIIDKVEKSGKLEQYKALAGRVHQMLERRRKILKRAGLLDEDTLGAWEASYKFYVPLKGWATDEQQDSMPRSGKGFAIAGKESQMAAGRKSKAASPVANAINDLSEAVLRHRKNEVGNAFLNLVSAYPNGSYWRVFTADNPEVDRKVVKKRDPATGKMMFRVEEQSVPMAMMADRYFMTKVGGETYYIKIDDERLLNAMRNIGPDNNGLLVRSLSMVTRLMSSLNTSYNPEFVISNFSRDIQTAILNLTSEQSSEDGKARGKKIAAKTVKDVPAAIRAINASLKGKTLDGKAGEWQKQFDQFRADGAKTGWFDMKDVDGQMEDLETMISMASGGTVNSARRAFRAVTDWVENTNAAIENGVRLSAYVNAIADGIPRAQAASLAKNMTVNFNRKGELGTTMNALYMFANASVQGTANFVRTLGRLNGQRGDRLWSRLNTAQKIAAGMAVGGFALSALNRMVAGEDDDGVNWWDKVPDYVKERNLVLMKSLVGGEPGEYWTIPLPYGYNIFPVLGTSMEQMIGSDKPAGDVAGNVVLAALGSFSPIGFEQSDEAYGVLAKNIMPTILRPVASISLNENFMGGPIYKENLPFGTQKPDSSLYFRSTPEAFKELAKGLNDATGGSDFRSGAVDLSPDVMQFLVGYYGGGAYDFFTSRAPNAALKWAQGVELEDREIPFYRKLHGKVLPYEDQSVFYDRRNEINQLLDERDNLRGRERVEFMKEYRDKMRLGGVMKSVETRLKNLRKQRDRIEGMDLSASEKDERLKTVEQRMKRAIDQFNERYNEVDN